MNPQVAPPEVTESAAAGTTTEQYRFTGEDVIEKIKQYVLSVPRETSAVNPIQIHGDDAVQRPTAG